MIIIGAVTVMVCFVLYQLAMLLRESKNAITTSRGLMEDASKTLKQVDLIVNDLQTSISSVRNTVEEVNHSILSPIRKIGYGISLVTAFLSGLKKDKEEQKENI